MYFSDKIKNRDNNFDFLRFFAASLVIISHSFALFGAGYEPLKWLSEWDSLGGLALAFFFVMSGFLITKSWIENPDLLNFTKKRFLRIVPGFFFAIFFVVFIIGPLVTTFNLNEYFNNPQLIIYMKNIFMFPIYYDLPGVFNNNIYPNAVNGSIWTLPVEVVMYFSVVAFAFLGIYKRKILPLAITLLFVFVDVNVLPKMGFKNTVFLYLPIVPFFKLLVYFFIGLCFYVYRNYIPYDKTIALLMLIIWVMSFRTQATHFISFLTLPYVIMFVGLLDIKLLKNFSKYGDFSYGLYIYAFPIQQTTIHFLYHRINLFEFFIISYFFTFIVAYLSWNLVEKPFLNLKNKRFRKWLFGDRFVY